MAGQESRVGRATGSGARRPQLARPAAACPAWPGHVGGRARAAGERAREHRPGVHELVSNSSTLAGATAVAASGNFAYATAYGIGPAHRRGHLEPRGARPRGLERAVDNAQRERDRDRQRLAYVASKNRNASRANNDDGTGNSLTILDIHTNPAQPVEVGHLHDAHNLFGAYGIGVSGSRRLRRRAGLSLQAALPEPALGNSFEAIDVSDPAPTRRRSARSTTSSLPVAWHGHQRAQPCDSVAISGTFAYVTAFNGNRLTVIDISNPAARGSSRRSSTRPTRASRTMSRSRATTRTSPIRTAPAAACPSSRRRRLQPGRSEDRRHDQRPEPRRRLPDPRQRRLRVRRRQLGERDERDRHLRSAASEARVEPGRRGALLHTTGVSLDSTGRFLVGSSRSSRARAIALFPPYPNQTGGRP